MVKEKPETASLEELAERIAQYANEADEKTIEAGKLICLARERVETELADHTTWTDWARENIKLSESRLRELQRIAEAEDPRKELERTRDMTRQRVEKHRRKKKVESVMPLRSSGDKTVTARADRQDDRQSPIEIGPEHGGVDHKERTDEPPLRNGGEVAATVEATDEQDQRDRLANWARSARIDHVRQVLDLIESLEQAEPGSDPENTAAPKAA